MQDFLARTDLITVDQAQGLRQMFRGESSRHVALVSNPFVERSGVALERLTASLAMQGRRVLVVDAGESSPDLPEEGVLDLWACVETLSPRVSYLPARGLTRRHVNAQGSAAGLLVALQRLPQVPDVVLFHAPASELARVFASRALRPVLLADEQPGSVQHAYAALKLLTLRAACASFDLLLLAPPRARRLARIAESLASCAERFTDATMHEWAAAHPSAPASESPEPALLRLAAAQLELDDLGMPSPLHGQRLRAAAPAVGPVVPAGAHAARGAGAASQFHFERRA